MSEERKQKERNKMKNVFTKRNVVVGSGLILLIAIVTFGMNLMNNTTDVVDSKAESDKEVTENKDKDQDQPSKLVSENDPESTNESEDNNMSEVEAKDVKVSLPKGETVREIALDKESPGKEEKPNKQPQSEPSKDLSGRVTLPKEPTKPIIVEPDTDSNLVEPIKENSKPTNVKAVELEIVNVKVK